MLKKLIIAAIFLQLCPSTAFAYSYNEIDKYRSMLTTEDFSNLSLLLDKRFSGSIKGEVQESEVDAILHSFDINDDSLAVVIDRFVEKDRTGYVAKLIRAVYNGGMAWRRRAGKWASETTDEQFKALYHYKQLALDDLDHVRTVRPRLMFVYAETINAYMALGDRENINLTYKKAIAVNPRSFRVNWNYVSTYLPWWGGSIEEMEAAIKLSESTAKTYKPLRALRGRIFSVQGTIRKRRKDYEGQLELNKEALKFGEYWAYYEGMAKALTRMKRYEEALDIYRKALKLRPHSESMNFACGNLARRFKLYSEAQTCYERAITMNPKKEIYYAQLSYLGRDIGNQEMQQKNLRKYYEVKLQKQGMEGTVTNVFSSPKK